MTISKKDLKDSEAKGFQEGYTQGLEVGKGLWQTRQTSAIIEAKIKLINSVGQTLLTQSPLLAGLAQVMDNAPPR